MKKANLVIGVLFLLVQSTGFAQDPAKKKLDSKSNEKTSEVKYTDEEIKKMKLANSPTYGDPNQKTGLPYGSTPQGGAVKQKIDGSTATPSTDTSLPK